jgi:hypothetical protein
MTNSINQTVINQVINLINEMDSQELIQLNNEYCESINAVDDQVFSNDEDFLNTFFYNNPDSLARAISYGEYHYSHNFVRFNGYGNLESFDYFDTDDLIELVPTMAEYISERFQDFSQFDSIDFHL